MLESIFRFPVPTICVLQGSAFAGGVGLVLACDMVLASNEATLSLPEPQRGIVAAIVSPLLKLRVGFGWAKTMLLSGRPQSGIEAERCGLIHWRVESDQITQRLSELMMSIQTGAPEAVRLTKQQLTDSVLASLVQEWDTAEGISATSRHGAEAKEGLLAFQERRPPNWQQ